MRGNFIHSPTNLYVRKDSMAGINRCFVLGPNRCFFHLFCNLDCRITRESMGAGYKKSLVFYFDPLVWRVGLISNRFQRSLISSSSLYWHWVFFPLQVISWIYERKHTSYRHYPILCSHLFTPLSRLLLCKTWLLMLPELLRGLHFK